MMWEEYLLTAPCFHALIGALKTIKTKPLTKSHFGLPRDLFLEAATLCLKEAKPRRRNCLFV